MWRSLSRAHVNIAFRAIQSILLGIFLPITAYAGGGHGHGGEEDHGESDGLVRITDVGLETSGIEIKKARQVDLQLSLNVNGYVVPNEYQTSHLRPRYPGIAKKVYVKLGQTVKEGQKLATIQANGSETNFDVKASFPGTVIEKDLVIGQFVSTNHEMFQVSNLKSVWAELSIPEHYVRRIRKGMQVSISNWSGDTQFAGPVFYLSSTIYNDSQSIMARVGINNSKGDWRPGVFVKAKISTRRLTNVLSVEKAAVQILEEKQVVFVEQEEGVFKPQPVELGRRNKNRVEVTEGLKSGDRYVAANSYILKADYLKSEASHDH